MFELIGIMQPKNETKSHRILRQAWEEYVITPRGMHTLFPHMLEFQIFEIRNILVAIIFRNCFEKKFHAFSG